VNQFDNYSIPRGQRLADAKKEEKENYYEDKTRNAQRS
jgi:hypothetical protein